MSVCQSGGIECLCDILCDGTRSGRDVDVTQLSVHSDGTACQSERVRSQPERVRSEAAGVIAQITSPSLVLSAHVDETRRASLLRNMSDLVPALTGMIWTTVLQVSSSCCCSFVFSMICYWPPYT